MTSMVPCREVVRLLWQYMDAELVDQVRREIEGHLAHCLECGDRHDFEARVREIIREKASGERAPEHLRLRLHAMLQMF